MQWCGSMLCQVHSDVCAVCSAGYIYTASCTMGTGSFPGVRCGRGVTLTPHRLLVPRSKIEYSCISTLLKGLRGL